MNRIRKFYKSKLVLFFIIVILFMFLNNTSLFTPKRTGEPLLLAHRGVAQTFNLEGVTNDTCTAERIHPPDHPFLENTIPSMEAAVKSGADVIEFDVHITKDNQFAVFHDWTLDCRTNGKGVTRDYTLSELKKLDVGYGYTADRGKTYPFRGKGIGLMPSMEEVLSHFPNQQFLIHVKSNDSEEGKRLAEHLSKMSETRLNQITVYGGDEPIESLHKQLPQLRVMSKATMKSCLLPYIATGWTGYVPKSCQRTELHIPEKIAPWLWGWPNKFLNRMDQHDVRTILVGGSGEFSGGFDSVGDLKRLPSNYTGGIWTNRIDKIAPVYEKK
ncbi:glycerophosphodiester phosphodiesterase family protein [Bacillus sp. DX1.1]|uniref:glycerophosphodiester phosphodiesterase family protein n=1 Tax=unclassified Bacillus (in: firmicutes) TaxID=185979 RepID=UPI0025702486|nr:MULTISPECIES: glycerophosphodiester phosphodiesterase family protein [unclassified Bacillus (in: firmicutes)]MDM5155143.1 glycerophosphodiester phosphodiesterase family protein [Bacillus sp. DX1.1]WJE79471.1 glycerophosphodiester phosphodiesterase family protein [Bacillus sp. DX3.1]